MQNLVRNIILLGLSAYGYRALWRFASENNTFALMSEQSTNNHLPRIDSAYPTEFTRISRLDVFLKSLLTLFWPMVNGTRPGSSLMCFYFAGQGIAAWILTVIEGMRIVNRRRWTVASLTTTYGLLFQGIGIAIIGPLFLCFSPTGDRSSEISFVKDIDDLNAIPLSTITGLIIPTVVMSLHCPTILTCQQKIDAIRLWQFFPLLCYVSQWIWSPICRRITPAPKTPKESLLSQRDSLRRVYLFGLCCAAIPHVGTWSICLTAILFPHLFAGDVPEQFHPASLFIPTSPFSGQKAHSVGQGTHWFLQWDMTLMFCMYLVWAYFAKLKVMLPGSTSSMKLIIRVLAFCCLTGPLGAVLVTIWERDEIVFSAAISRNLKKEKIVDGDRARL